MQQSVQCREAATPQPSHMHHVLFCSRSPQGDEQASQAEWHAIQLAAQVPACHQTLMVAVQRQSAFAINRPVCRGQ